MKTISILNLKGGVAKTFTAANMAYELYRRGYKVLLIDNDKQGNLSKAYSRYDAENVAPATRLLAGDWENADELIQHTEYEGIDIVTANMSLFGATWNLTKEDSENQIERYKALVTAKVLGFGYAKFDYIETERAYDYCIIDCSPSVGLLLTNALSAANEVIIPMQAQPFSVVGMSQLTNSISSVQRKINPGLHIRGVLLTMTQHTKVSEHYAHDVRAKYGRTLHVFTTEIPYNVKVQESQAFAAPTILYEPKSSSARAYVDFTQEVLGHGREEQVYERDEDARNR